MLVFFAQTAADFGQIASGPAGWTATGILVAVLYWLMMHHLPNKDKFIKDLIDKHSEQVEKLIQKHEAAVTLVTVHCEREMQEITNGVVAQLQLVKTEVSDHRDENREQHQQTRHQVASVAQALNIKVATGDIKLKPEKPGH